METRTQPFESKVDFNVWAEQFAQHVARTMEQRAEATEDFSVYNKADLDQHIVDELDEFNQDLEPIYEGVDEYGRIVTSPSGSMDEDQFVEFMRYYIVKAIGWRVIHELDDDCIEANPADYHANLVDDPDPAPYLWEVDLQRFDVTMIVLPEKGVDYNPSPHDIWDDDQVEVRIVDWR